MGIQEEIFEVFFKKLEEDEKFTTSIVEKLKTLWKSGEIASQERILEVVKEGSGNGSKNQND
jgi:DNA polymerase III delta subunit